MVIALLLVIFKKQVCQKVTIPGLCKGIAKSPGPSSPSSPSTGVASPSTGGNVGPVAAGQVPQKVLDILKVDSEQMNNILSIINGAEQSNIKWNQRDNGESVFSYCENIGDGRGATFGIAGFTTGDESGKAVFTSFGTSIEQAGSTNCKKSSCPFCDFVKQHGNDPKFQAAQWQAYINGPSAGYIEMVMKYKPAHINSALAKGLLLDCSMNAGEEKEGNAWGVKEVSAAAKGATEEQWCKSFISFRKQHFTKASGSGDKRMSPWEALIADKKFDMKGIDVCKYAWCNASGLGKGCAGCPGQSNK